MNELTTIENRSTALQSNRKSPTPADLLLHAMNSGVDIEKLEKLMALQTIWEEKEAKKAYVSAISEFKKNAPDIYKDKQVTYIGTSYTHASLGGICEAVTGELAKYGLSHRWDTKQDAGMIEVSCIITHKDGHSEATKLEAQPDNSGKKNSIQQVASTITYLQRYTLLAACGLATKDMVDDDGVGAGEPQQPQQPQQEQKAKHILTDNAFKKAYQAIKNGEWTVPDILAAYQVTADQEIAFKDLENEMAGKK